MSDRSLSRQLKRTAVRLFFLLGILFHLTALVVLLDGVDTGTKQKGHETEGSWKCQIAASVR